MLGYIKKGRGCWWHTVTCSIDASDQKRQFDTASVVNLSEIPQGKFYAVKMLVENDNNESIPSFVHLYSIHAWLLFFFFFLVILYCKKNVGISFGVVSIFATNRINNIFVFSLFGR